MKKPEKIIIGWREYVDIPEWGIHGISAKIDTGARTSALHVENIKLLANGRIRFFVVLCGKDDSKRKKIITHRLKMGSVKSSIGIKTDRWYVQTQIMIGRFKRAIALNLVSREGMNFRMLLGRKAIDGHFLVDVDHSYLLKKKK